MFPDATKFITRLKKGKAERGASRAKATLFCYAYLKCERNCSHSDVDLGKIRPTHSKHLITPSPDALEERKFLF
jgi:hypothetical protein